MPYVSMYLFFVHSYVIKNRSKGKNGNESNDEIKEGFFKSLIDGEIEFKFRWHRRIKKDIYFVKPKEPDKFRARKTLKSFRKVSKNRVANKVREF